MLVLLLALALVQSHLVVVSQDLSFEPAPVGDAEELGENFGTKLSLMKDDDDEEEQREDQQSEAKQLYCLECQQSCKRRRTNGQTSKRRQKKPKNLGTSINRISDNQRQHYAIRGSLECKCRTVFDLSEGQLKCKNMARSQVQADGRYLPNNSANERVLIQAKALSRSQSGKKLQNRKDEYNSSYK